MPFSTNSVAEIFSGATASDGDLTLPSGSIRSYYPSGNSLTTPTVYEMVYGLLDTMADSVGTGNLTNLTVTQTQTISGNTLTKRYNFTVNLDLSGNTVDAILNVKAEPTV
jgi:hypothetical protein